MIGKELCPACGQMGVPIASRTDALSDPSAALAGGCEECGASLEEIRERIRGDPGWAQTGLPELRTREAVGIYFAGALLGIVMALAAQLRLGLNGIRVLFWYFGVVYLIASTGRPWWLVEVIRYTGFLQSIRNNTVLRIVLLALGLGTLAFAALAPWDQALPRL